MTACVVDYTVEVKHNSN